MLSKKKSFCDQRRKVLCYLLGSLLFSVRFLVLPVGKIEECFFFFLE